MLAAGAAGRSELRAGAATRTEPDPIVLADAGEVIARSKATVAATAGADVLTYTHAAEAAAGRRPASSSGWGWGDGRHAAVPGGRELHEFDVISASHPPIPPEEPVLDRYVFLPHARSGIAAALTNPFDWDSPTRATVEMRVPVARRPGDGRVDAEMTVHVYGPADVTEIDARQVIRAFPKADAPMPRSTTSSTSSSTGPDLPWLFTPAGPDASGRLVPWITLVVRRAAPHGVGRADAARPAGRRSAATSCSRSATPGPGRTRR